MIAWIQKIQWGRVLLISGVYTSISFLLLCIESIFTAQYYQMPQYAGLWSTRMRFSAAEYYITSIVATYTVGVSLCIIYYYLREYLPKKKWQRVFFYADILVATSFIFFTIPTYVMFNVPISLLLVWFINGFISYLIASTLIVHNLSK